MKKVLLIALVLSFALVVPVSATPSTIIWIPSTDIQPANKTHLGIDNYFTAKPLASGQSTGAFTSPDYGLTWGGTNFEYGIDYIASQPSNPLYFNAKFNLLNNEASKVNIVAGVYNVGTSKATNQEVKYVLTSKTISDGTRFALGYGVGRREALGSDNKMILASIDKQLNDKWWVAVDYQGGKSALGATNVGFSYNFAPNASVIFAYDIYNNKDYKNTITTQLDINF
ncbi:hypothetical protein [Sporomusa sp.]|uniref:hypothetical protein n=1 Tax=Sporomusa sp. TaxID=2078658 RepID=UPI002C68A452|nr:hypothetical protein [Sporomusa sp.]HWR42447.1 hypothetical protein [Sporomusa sp.]